MGKKSPKAPAAPDPVKTAEAQTQQNKETAYWNAVLNNVNQITPYGTLTYKQTGGGKQYNMDAYNAAMEAYKANPGGYSLGALTDGRQATLDGKKWGYIESAKQWAPVGAPGWADATTNQKLNALFTPGGAAPRMEDYYTGETPPEFTSTIKLTPEQQAILDKQTANETALLNLGGDQLSRIQGAVSTPFSFAGLEAPEVAQGQFEDAVYSRLNPQFARDEEALRSRLINQGIGQGSQAYQREMELLNQARNDARTQAVLQGQQYGLNRRNQAITEYTTQRNAPLNEYIAMTSGVQVQNPQFSSQGYQGANPVDMASLINNQYNAQMGQYNSKVAQNNANMAAAGSLLGAAAGFAGGSGSLFGYKLW